MTIGFGLGACGDDGGNTPRDAPDHDAKVVDAMVDAQAIDGAPLDAPPDASLDTPPDAPPDAPPAQAAVSATIAVTDVVLTHPVAEAVDFRGGSIDLVFSDLTAEGRGGTEVFRGGPSAPIGSCLMTQFGPTSGLPFPPADVGQIDIAGLGLNRTVGPCTFDATAQRYLCASHGDGGSPQTVHVTADAAGPDTAMLTWVGAAPFPVATNSLQGSYLIVSGFDAAGNNSGASVFPIVAQTTTSSLVIVNTGAVTTADPEADISYTILNGFAPAPLGPDFLVGNQGVTVTKAANDVWPAIDLTTDVAGEGFALDTTSAAPEAFPTTTVDAPLRYSCDNLTPGDTTDDTCGDASDTPLKAFILSGRATRKSTAGLLPFQMPAEDGTTEWLEWQCAILFGKSVTLPVEAVNAIVDFAPTRVELRVLNGAGHLVNAPDPLDGPDRLTLLVGHGVVGHTDGAD